MKHIQKTLMTKKVIKRASCFIFLIFIFSHILPAIIISDGVDQYTGKEKEFARVALNAAESHLSSPSSYKAYTTKMQVTNVRQVDNACINDWVDYPNYEADIKSYTYFGIPSNLKLHIRCGNVSPIH